jgi:hypoxanthine phosphoribosyltransferase
MDDMPKSSPRHDSDPRSDRPRPEPIPNPKRPNGAPIPFSHPAEEAFAKVLDFYHERWEYEPMTFPLGWDETGRITMAFSPDFYLPDEDLYVELTTMRQRLVTQKNRKLRLLSELYPGVKCKLIYRRDVANLAVKYGLFEADSKKARQVYRPHPLDGVTGWGGDVEESEEMERDA